MSKKKFAGVYTGKYFIGQRVNSGDHYPTGMYRGTILVIADEQNGVAVGKGVLHFTNVYGVHWDGDAYDDGSPLVTYMSETDILPE